jgi:serine/threonine protein kinase
MAEVFKARVTGASGFQREVVLKRMHAAHSDDPEFVTMFKDEARILGVLHHPNVVQALDFGKSAEQLYLVLEYVEGPSLGRVLRSGRPVSPAVVAYLGREIARALDYVHNVEDEAGTPLRLVHRDVTPSNIIVTPSGTVKLLDFGIAKFATAMHATRGGHAKGKPGYLAPEQLRDGQEIDGRVDLFALGVVLHELLAGERLFSGDNDLSTMKQLLEMKIPRPSTKLAGVPPALDRIVMRALARDPAKRYASASEMARELDEVVVAAGLRQEDVAAFVRDVERASPFPAAAATRATGRRQATAITRRAIPSIEGATQQDLFLPLRWWMGGLSSGRRAALIAGLSLLLGTAGAVGWGVTSLTTAAPRAPGGVVRGRPTSKPAPGPQRTIAAAFSAER